MYAIISCHDAKLAKTTNGIFGKIRLGYRLKICGSISSAYFRNFELGNPFCDAFVIKIAHLENSNTVHYSANIVFRARFSKLKITIQVFENCKNRAVVLHHQQIL